MREYGSGEIKRMLADMNLFFNAQKTRPISFRIKQLMKLKRSILKYQKNVEAALEADLGKCSFEGYYAEIGLVLKSIGTAVRDLGQWSKGEKVKTPFYLMPGKSVIMSEPYGTVLIISPFNYPFQLVFEPLIGAIAAGNCAVIKPSEASGRTAEAIEKIIAETFDENYIRCIQGGVETTNALIHAKFDFIFFTGSQRVGKIVMKAAADNLIPVVLELGGKSPVIIDKSADIKRAARKIAWGKNMNCGQTCVAPDYVFVERSRKKQFIQEYSKQVEEMYGTDPSMSRTYGRIIDRKAFERLTGILREERENILFGGNWEEEALYIAPSVINVTSVRQPSMREELFGPILPVIAYQNLDNVISYIRKQPKPLALYLFTRRRRVVRRVLGEISFGGGCVNDTISHIANGNLPFGGVGASGIGAYHGKYSFDVFSHKKSVLVKGGLPDGEFMYPPYSVLKKLPVYAFLR